MLARNWHEKMANLWRTLAEHLDGLLPAAVPLLLRSSLGITFVWFGGLKLAGEPTLPAALIAALIPSVDPDLLIPLVGAFEVVLGAGVLIGRRMPIFLRATALHLSSTFLVLLFRPEVAFVDGNPLLLSVEGEYVFKNLVLLAATASLALHVRATRPFNGHGVRLARLKDADVDDQTESAA
jgi:putative oxidoreductase